jgi:hypothetical protein
LVPQTELLKLQKSGQFPDEFVVYYESIKRELKIRDIYECRCDERLRTKTEDFKRLTYTGLVLELEHLKIETRLIDEKFAVKMYPWLGCFHILISASKRKLRGGSGNTHDQIVLTEVLKLQKSGQFPDEPVRKEV